MAAPFVTVIVDNEAVGALSDVRHAKHGAALALLEGVAQRRQRRGALRVLVPVAVRIEAGWDRTSPASSVVNRVSGASDVELTAAGADRATRIRVAMAVSVVDAAIAEAAEGAPKPVVIITLDGGDMTALAGRITGDVRVLPI